MYFIPMEDKDIIKTKKKGDFIAVRIKQPNTEEPSLLFCDKIGYMRDRDQFPKGSFDHHIMAYKDGNLIFKVWLPNAATDKEFDGIREALESVGMEATYD